MLAIRLAYIAIFTYLQTQRGNLNETTSSFTHPKASFLLGVLGIQGVTVNGLEECFNELKEVSIL